MAVQIHITLRNILHGLLKKKIYLINKMKIFKWLELKGV